MSDVSTSTTKAKPKAAAANFASDMPKFEIPRFDLPTHWLEVALHTVYTNGDRVDEAELFSSASRGLD